MCLAGEGAGAQEQRYPADTGAGGGVLSDCEGGNCVLLRLGREDGIGGGAEAGDHAEEVSDAMMMQ